jgi:glutathione synthase/RimK-type ligase-like ATP-grasp enzyme
MEKVIIIAGLNGRPSMRAVYRKLIGGIFCDTRCDLVYENNQGLLNQHTRSTLTDEDFKDATVICWGLPDKYTDVDCKRIINAPLGVCNASNKKKARTLMQSAGVRVPRMATYENHASISLPCVSRPNYHHKGKDFIVVNSREELLKHLAHPGRYVSEYIYKDAEYRVHVAMGKAIAFSEKPKPNNGDFKWNENPENPFYEVTSVPEDVKNQAVAAVKAVGLDMGGVDVMWKEEENEAYVLEINTAPTLYGCDFEIEAYRKVFQEVINEEI